MTLTLISIGLADEQDLTQKAIKAAQNSHKLYAELYTTYLNTTITKLEQTTGKQIQPLPRASYEEQSNKLLEEAKTHNIGILIGGDALSATTHLSLILDAAKQNIPTKIIHGSSILTAIAETGLSLYKFGRTVTLPLPEKAPPTTVLRVLQENREHGLHTLILLDLNTEKQTHLPANTAIQILLDADQPETYNNQTLTIATTRLGWPNSTIQAGPAQQLAQQEYGPPPQAIIIPGKLHFIEEEALKTIANCPQKTLDNHKPTGETQRLIEKYSKSCRNVIKTLKHQTLPATITKQQVNTLIQHATNYLDDGEYYKTEKKPTALVSVSYAEGILDALKILNLVQFEW